MDTDIKICKRCNLPKPAVEFYAALKRSEVTDKSWVGRDSHCIPCRIKYAYGRREARKRQAVAHLGGKCLDCGLVDIPDVYDFHHLDPSTKDGAISNLINRSWARIVVELEKCVLLCAVCHRKRHAVWKVK